MIAYGMLYTVAVGLPVALAALVISGVLRRYGRPERVVWLVALLTALVLPLVALLDPFGAPDAIPPIPETGVIGLPAVMVLPADDPALGPGQVLVALWLLLSGALAVRWAVATLRLARESRSWSPTTLDGVPVWMTEKLGPAVAGALRPRVLVPGWLRTLPARQRSLILLHEQEHIRARDPMLIVLARVARTLTPWNPVVWLLSSRLVRAVELDCDRRVLRQSSDVAAYGHTLLTVSERRPGRLVAVAAFAESEAPLRSRILAMTTPSRAVSVVALLTSMVLGLVLLVGALQIPVPTVRIQVSFGPEAGEATEASGERPVERAPARPADRSVVRRPGLPGAEATEAGPGSQAVGGTEAGRSNGRTREEAAPSAEEALRRVRQDAESRRGAGSAERGAGGSSSSGSTAVQRRAEPSDGDVSQGPVFTPYTVAPSILNRAEVVQALVDSYPALLRDAGIGGTVRVYFFIDAAGRVRDTRLDQSSGHAALDDAALRVASVYRFSPALNRDAPTAVWVSFPITFRPAL